MNIIGINNRTLQKIDPVLIRRLTNTFLKSYRLDEKEVSIALVGDKTVKKLNKIYLGVNRLTDVLAFGGDKNFLGEIIIAYPQIIRQARRYKNTAKGELAFILVHGLLHLVGYDDKTKRAKQKMEKLSEKFFRSFKF